jgi:fatty acid desaturase
MTALPFLLAALAFSLFGLATDQHHGKRLRRPCPKRRATALRGAAVMSLALGFALSLHVWGAVFGPIGWAATVMSGAALAFCGLNFVPLRGPRSRR